MLRVQELINPDALIKIQYQSGPAEKVHKEIAFLTNLFVLTLLQIDTKSLISIKRMYFSVYVRFLNQNTQCLFTSTSRILTKSTKEIL